MHPPTSNRLFLWAAAAGLGALVQLVRMRLRRRKAQSTLARRQQRSDAEFGALFPPGQDETAVMLRQMLAKALRTKLGGITPADRVGTDLQVGEESREAMLRFIMDAEDAFDTAMPACDRCMRMTIGQLVAYVCGRRGKATRAERAPMP
jgi:hypothetical protein